MTSSLVAPTARTPLEVALACAAEEGLAPNLRRWLALHGHIAGEPVEMQALNVSMGRYSENRVAHAFDVETMLALLGEAERWSVPALYFIANEVDAAVATRAAPGRWRVMSKGESTSDAEIVSRRVLYVDIDATRAKGTSATTVEVAATHEVAEAVHQRIARALGSDVSLALGDSGNGRAVLVALDSVRSTSELTLLVKGILAALRELYARAGKVEIDGSVCDPKRLLPAWGTMKRKGAAGVASRPHRRTALVCRDTIERVGGDALQRLLDDLCVELSDTQRVVVDKIMGKRPTSATTSPTQDSRTREEGGSPFTRANACDVHDVAQRLGLLDGERPKCPGCGSTDAGVAFVKNGLKCSHSRCSQKGVHGGFRTPVDLVMEAQNVAPKVAVNVLAEWFAFEGFVAREKKRIETTSSPSALRQSPAEYIRSTIGKPVVRLSTGLQTLDEATRGGLMLGKLAVIGGAPGAGKTTLQTQIADHYARGGVHVMFVCRDEDREGILYRIGQLHGLALEDLENDVPGARDALARVLEEQLPTLSVRDQDEEGVSLAEVVAELADKARGASAVLCVDSLQTILVQSEADPRDRRLQVDAVLAALKTVARQRGWLVIATSELARGAYRSRDARETVSDLASFKETGGIEYQAAVGLVLRSLADEPDIVDVTMPKARRGTPKAFRLRLDRRRARFAEVAIPESSDSKVDASVEFYADVEAAREALKRNPGIHGNEAWAVLFKGGKRALGTERARAAMRYLGSSDEVENRGSTKRPRLFWTDPSGPHSPESPGESGESGESGEKETRRTRRSLPASSGDSNSPDSPPPYRAASSAASSVRRNFRSPAAASSRRVLSSSTDDANETDDADDDEPEGGAE